METTTFLASIWGPIALAAGIGMYASRPYYVRVYREIERVPFALIMFGMFALAFGIIHVQAHNVWSSLPASLVSLFGWGLVIKGALSLVVPKIADKAGDWWANTKLIPLVAVILLVLGAYLSWFAYFA